MSSLFFARGFKLAAFAGLFATRLLAREGPVADLSQEARELERLRSTLEVQRQEIEHLEQEARNAEATLQRLRESLASTPVQTQPRETASNTPGFEWASRSQTLPSLQVSPKAAAEPAPDAPPQAILKISDTVNFRFGVQLQPSYEALQDPNGGGYSQNFYLRRARFLLLGTLGHGVSVFLQTDAPRIGYSGATGVKNISNGLQVIDGFAQWAFGGKAIALQAGLFLVPSWRQILTRNWTYLSMDIASYPIQQGTIEESTLGRDYGMGFNGALFGEHLTYRTGVFSGYRDPALPQPPPAGPAAGSRNALRYAGRVMYDFFDTEYGYAYNGTNLGKGKFLAVGAFGDGQGAYRAYGGDVFFDWPVGPGAVTAEADYLHYDGHRFVYLPGGTPTTLPEQQTFFSNVGYYFCAVKLQPFLRYEILDYPEIASRSRELSRFGGGVNYYVLGFNFKITGFYERLVPKIQPTTAVLKDTNRFVLQLQGFFY